VPAGEDQIFMSTMVFSTNQTVSYILSRVPPAAAPRIFGFVVAPNVVMDNNCDTRVDVSRTL